MKRLAIASQFLLLLVPALSAQILPEAPAAAPDPSWNRLSSLNVGQRIIVTTTDSRSLHCLFGTVTDTYLFCAPPGNPEGVGYRFDRAEVLSVDYDRPDAALMSAPKREHNYHPAWISSMIAGGVIVGLVAAQNTDAGRAAQDGLIGAAVVGAIGAPMAFLPHPQAQPSWPIYPGYEFGAHLAYPLHRRVRR